VLSTVKPAFEFLPEVEGIIVNGKVINKTTGAPVGHSPALLSAPGVGYAFSSATSNADGSIYFGFMDIYKNNVIVVEPSRQNDSNIRIDINSAFSNKYSSYTHRLLLFQKQSR
jgi:hypothetical protein